MTDRFGHILADEAQNRFVFMKYRIHKILLVCCSYDGYILEEDGRIEAQINRETLLDRLGEGEDVGFADVVHRQDEVE